MGSFDGVPAATLQSLAFHRCLDSPGGPLGDSGIESKVFELLGRSEASLGGSEAAWSRLGAVLVVGKLGAVLSQL